jgi:hypothetical protein
MYHGVQRRPVHALSPILSQASGGVLRVLAGIPD